MSLESLRTLQPAGMVPSEPDYMGGWYARLPAERREALFVPRMDDQGVEGSSAADQDRPDTPAHPAFWKMALAEIVREQQGDAAADAIPWERIQNRNDANRWLGGMFRFDTAGGGSPLQPREGFPTDADVAQARSVGFGRELPFQSYLRGEVIRRVDVPTKGWPPEKLLQAMDTAKPKSTRTGAIQNIQRQRMMETALIANRSALAGLGFDPERMTFFVQDHDPDSEDPFGMYVRDRDQIYLSGKWSAYTTPTHESIHRGIDLLLNRGRLSPELSEWIEKPGVHEMIVRKVMADHVRVQEGSDDYQRSVARWARAFFQDPENARRLAELERLAEQEIQRQRPGGPR